MKSALNPTHCISVEPATGKLLMGTLSEICSRYAGPNQAMGAESATVALWAEVRPLAETIEYIARKRGLNSWADREIAPITAHLSRWSGAMNLTPSGKPLLLSYARKLQEALRTLYLHAACTPQPVPAPVRALAHVTAA